MVSDKTRTSIGDNKAWAEAAPEIDRLRAALAEAERGRDIAQTLYETEKNVCGEWIASVKRVEADLAAAREVMTAISTMPNRNGFELRHYDLLTEAIGSARAFIERTTNANQTGGDGE